MSEALIKSGKDTFAPGFDFGGLLDFCIEGLAVPRPNTETVLRDARKYVGNNFPGFVLVDSLALAGVVVAQTMLETPKPGDNAHE